MRISAKPFNEYWIFCIMNDWLSLLVEKNPTFLEYACMNSYSYHTRGDTCWWRDIEISWNDDYLSILKQYVKYNKFETLKNDLLVNIVYRLKSDIPVYLSLDAYYAFPNRYDFQREHNIHDFLVIGYDESNDNLGFFTDTYAGYGEIYIPYKNVMDAIVSNNDKVSFREVIISKIIPDYSLDKLEIKDNAKRLMIMCANLSFQNIWNVDRNRDFSKVSYEIYTITKIAERQKANKALLRQMKKYRWISEELEQDVANETDDIFNIWKKVKAIWIKMSYRYNEKYINNLNWLTKEAIVKEAYIWNKIYNSL
ncbi:MAG: hypothetical protein K1W13_01250 [Lachnospiraceae bacterium]